MGSAIEHRTRLCRALVALCTVTAAGLLATGCARPTGVVKSPGSSSAATVAPPARESTPEESWDRAALAAAQPCLLALSDGEDPSLRAAKLDGRVVADDLWKAPSDTYVLLLDADAEGPRVAVAVSRTPTEAPAASRDTFLVLDDDGAVTTASEPTTDFPLASAAVFLGNGDLLWLRRRETQSSVETTVGVTDARTGKVSPVVLAGTWPKHRFVASLVPLRTGSEVAVVLKTDGSTSPHDDFAVVIAEYQNDRLVARTAPYRDDTLFTLGPGPESGTLVYARAENEESSQADELIELRPSGTKWSPKTLLRDARCDPGFDFPQVCSGGPDQSVLYRAASNPAAAVPRARLKLLPHTATKPKDTGIMFDRIGDQWLWLGTPIL
jgi:hypothetical protein